MNTGPSSALTLNQFHTFLILLWYYQQSSFVDMANLTNVASSQQSGIFSPETKIETSNDFNKSQTKFLLLSPPNSVSINDLIPKEASNCSSSKVFVYGIGCQKLGK